MMTGLFAVYLNLFRNTFVTRSQAFTVVLSFPFPISGRNRHAKHAREGFWPVGAVLAWLLLHQPQLYTAGFSVVIAAVGGRRWHSQAHVSGRCALSSINALPWCHCSDGWACHRASRRSPIAFSSSSGNLTDKAALTMQVSAIPLSSVSPKVVTSRYRVWIPLSQYS